MTTAGRATFDPAKGGRGKNEGNLAVLSKQYSSRDMPGHLKLKTRQPGQFTQDELLKMDFRKELQDKEQCDGFKIPITRPKSTTSSVVDGCEIEMETETNNDDTCDATMDLNLIKKSFQPIPEALSNLDKDDDDNIDDNSDFEQDDSELRHHKTKDNKNIDSSDEDDDDDDDETAELLAELQRIKKERAENNLKKEMERQAQEAKIQMENTKIGNPLLNIDSKNTFVVKRRWDDDVVFKNCNPGNNNKQKTFINDTIRSEFHRKFMEKYVK